jgi:hypothetical protein
MKTIHEYFALTEDEYKITILSYYDIFKEDYMEKIEMALQKYDLRDIEAKAPKPFQSAPPQFPSLSFGTLYTVEATIGQMPRGMYEQIKMELNQTTHIPVKYFFVSEDGKIPQVTTSKKADDEALLKQAMGESPRDFPEDDISVQTLVGQESVHELMKNMADRKKAREEESKAISESILYRATHNVLKEHTGRSLKKGIYEFTIKDGQVFVGDRKDENAGGILIKSAVELKEALAPKVPSFAEKYKIERHLNEVFEEGDDYKARASFLLNVMTNELGLSPVMKPGFDVHKPSIHSVDLDINEAERYVAIRVKNTTALKSSIIKDLQTKCNCADVELELVDDSVKLKFEW